MMRVPVMVAMASLACLGCQRATRAACALDDTTSVSTRIAGAWHALTDGDTEQGSRACMPASRV